MPASFFEKLTGTFACGRPVAAVPPEKQLTQSIAGYLCRYYNTRQGSLVHLPEYGLPDVAQLIRTLPGSLSALQECLSKDVLRYEPRLSKFSIRPLPFNPLNSEIIFELSAVTIKGTPLKLKAICASSGQVKVLS